jgi:hypothetical protein
MSGSPRPSLGPGHTFRSRPVCGPYGRETARMRTGLRPQSAARVVQVRRARYHLLPTYVSPAVPSRASLAPCVALIVRTFLLAFLSVALTERSRRFCGKTGLFMSRLSANTK